mmetsp:Transcript_79479/g.204568  ORF Transcript_79479/g.204568 Transcript_79479/m.204568 type:complete len:545 (-) Transcript_79479:66-1700(-)
MARASSRSLLAFAVLVLLSVGHVQAEVFLFDSELVPEGRTLVAKYMFYVYAHKDAPDRSKGHPYVQFSDFSLESVGDGEDEEHNVGASAASSVQVSLIPWEDFWTLIDKDRFCSTPDDVMLKDADTPNSLLLRNVSPGNYSSKDVHVHTVAEGEAAPASSKKNLKTQGREALKRTGVYLLVITNCGESAEVTISGKVLVRNSFGFLPGNEYGKLLLYAGVAVAYFASSIFWVALSLRHWQDLIYIHYCISVVVILGLIEAILWWGYLAQWNATGISYHLFLSCAILISGSKTVVTFILVLVTSLGKGVTKPNLEGSTLMKIWALGILYVVLDFTRMYVSELRQRYSLSVKFVATTTLPTATLSAIIMTWVFIAVSGLLKDLREQGQDVKLRLYQRFACIMVFGLLVAIAALLLQLYDLPGRAHEWWSYHWMCTDGVTTSAFLLFILSMMCIWMPEEGGKRMAYSQQIGARDDKDDMDFAPTGFGNDPESTRIDTAVEFLGLGKSLGQDATETVEMAEQAAPSHQDDRNEPSPETIGSSLVKDQV